MKLTFYGHSSFQIKRGNYVIYIDPHVERFANMEMHNSLEKADLILITHFDPDHYNRETIEKVWIDQTKIYSTKEVASELNTCIAIVPGEIHEFDGLKIKAIEMKDEKHGENLSFLIKIEDKTIYFVGDTRTVPEAPEHDVDIMFVPIGGTHTMTPEEAYKLCEIVKPKIVIPTHFGRHEGHMDYAIQLKELVGDKAKVIIPEDWETIEI